MRARALLVLVPGLVLASGAPADEPAATGAGSAPQAGAAAPVLSYELSYDARVVRSERVARVEIRLGAGAELVRSIRLRIDPERHFAFQADGELVTEPQTVLWKPPGRGGSLRYTFRIDHQREAASYDARCAENWALFRADDLVPPAHVVSRKGSQSRARLRLRVPEGWSVVAPWERVRKHTFVIDAADRRFDRPVGWLVMGRLGVLRERIAGSRVAIAGPVGQNLRRLDMLALLRWTLPELRDALGTLPERILIVSAGDPMWRGGLSGPDSVFVHTDRPLIASDLTSPLLHELVHAVMSARSGPGGDWVAEGMAELYSLELLRRSRTVSRRRYQAALRALVERGRGVTNLRVEHADAAVAARGVAVLRALDQSIEEATEGAAGLDEVLALLARRNEPVTTEALRAAAERVAGRDLGDFFRSRVPGP